MEREDQEAKDYPGQIKTENPTIRTGSNRSYETNRDENETRTRGRMSQRRRLSTDDYFQKSLETLGQGNHPRNRRFSLAGERSTLPAPRSSSSSVDSSTSRTGEDPLPLRQSSRNSEKETVEAATTLLGLGLLKTSVTINKSSSSSKIVNPSPTRPRRREPARVIEDMLTASTQLAAEIGRSEGPHPSRPTRPKPQAKPDPYPPPRSAYDEDLENGGTMLNGKDDDGNHVYDKKRKLLGSHGAYQDRHHPSLIDLTTVGQVYKRNRPLMPQDRSAIAPKEELFDHPVRFPMPDHLVIPDPPLYYHQEEDEDEYEEDDDEDDDEEEGETKPRSKDDDDDEIAVDDGRSTPT